MARYTREHLEVRVLTMAEVGRLTGAAVWLTGLDTHCYTLYMDRYMVVVCMREYIIGRTLHHESCMSIVYCVNFETILVFASYR